MKARGGRNQRVHRVGGAALSGEGGGGGSTCSRERPRQPGSPPRSAGEEARRAGAARAPPISRASCRRAPRYRRSALLGPRPQQIAAVLQYPRTLARRHWHRPGLEIAAPFPWRRGSDSAPARSPAPGPPRPARCAAPPAPAAAASPPPERPPR